MLVPGAIGIGLCNPSLVSLVSGAAGKHEQGRVQGAAGALESLGRTIGPVWGNGALQLSRRRRGVRFGRPRAAGDGRVDGGLRGSAATERALVSRSFPPGLASKQL